MKWVEIDHTHINTNQIQTFFWQNGKLFITLSGRDVETWDDPDRKLYFRICQQQGIRPREGETE